MPSLATFLANQIPNGLDYDDAVQLCLRLYAVSDQELSSFSEPLTKENLSAAFAELAKSGWVRDPFLTAPVYGANVHEVTDKGHWIEVIASIFKRGKDIMNIDRGTELIRMIGFDHAAPDGRKL